MLRVAGGSGWWRRSRQATRWRGRRPSRCRRGGGSCGTRPPITWRCVLLRLPAWRPRPPPCRRSGWRRSARLLATLSPAILDHAFAAACSMPAAAPTSGVAPEHGARRCRAGRPLGGSHCASGSAPRCRWFTPRRTNSARFCCPSSRHFQARVVLQEARVGVGEDVRTDASVVIAWGEALWVRSEALQRGLGRRQAGCWRLERDPESHSAEGKALQLRRHRPGRV